MYESITYGEEVVEAELQDALLQRELGPDELEVSLGEEAVGAADVGRLDLEEVAVRMHGAAVVEGGGVDGDDEGVVEQVGDALAAAEALAEQLQQRPGPRPRLVHRRDDHRPVLRCHLRKQLGQAGEFVLHAPKLTGPWVARNQPRLSWSIETVGDLQTSHKHDAATNLFFCC